MSLAQSHGGYGGGAPSRYPYPPEGDQHSRPPPSRLPSMSSLLNHEPSHPDAQPTPPGAHGPPPYGAVEPQSPPPPPRMSHREPQPHPHPHAGPPHIYPHPHPHPHPHPPPHSHPHPHPHHPPPPPPQPGMSGHLAQPPPPSMLMSMSMQSQRSLVPDGEAEYTHRDPARRPSEASIAPSHYSFDQEGPYSRRASTFSDASSRRPSHAPTPQAMNISGLLSGEPRYANHPHDDGEDQPNHHSPRRERPPANFVLRMRQQPIAARACGFGERDRRVIDPPPILQMEVTGPNLTATEISTLIRSPFSVIHCTLWDPETDTDATAMPGTTDKRQQRRLMGTLVSSPFVGKDEHGVEGCFFTFPDLSVRTPGKYSLRFALVRLDPNRMGPGDNVPVTSRIWSSEFQVFNAKDFAGMRASTALTKTLKGQGCLISVKKGNGKHEDDYEEEDDENGGEGPSRRGGKRSKK